MPSVISSEMLIKKSVVVDITVGSTTNGGRMSAVEAVDNVKNNVWPDVSQAERTAGTIKFAKLFIHVANDDDLGIQDVKVFIPSVTPGGDRMLFHAGTSIDDQADLTGSETLFAAGELNANISAGGASLVVDLEAGSGADTPFANGDVIWISDGTNSEFKTLHAATGVSYSTDEVTLTLQAADTFDNSYLAATPTVVSSVYEPGTIDSSIIGVTETTAGSGTVDETDIVVDHIGSIYEVWTITMGAAGAYTCSGDTLGSVGASNRSSTFAPNNPDQTKPYFTIPPAAWENTWADGDTYVFTTVPAYIPVWMKRVIPAGTAALGADQAQLSINAGSS
jgi:hypothetical protein